MENRMFSEGDPYNVAWRSFAFGLLCGALIVLVVLLAVGRI